MIIVIVVAHNADQNNFHRMRPLVSPRFQFDRQNGA
jgi:hypothetical protein